jgi:hypothetical protein
MTSQRDKTVGHTAGDEMTDDPILVERRDEILGGPPADDPAADDASARVTSDEPASDELIGRHAAPEMGGAGLEQEPPPLVVPSGPAPDDLEAPSGAATPGAQATVPEPETPGSSPVAASSADADPVAASPADADLVAASSADAGAPAASPGGRAGTNGDGIPATALAEQQWPAIQAMFVDDPKGSVERAAAAADEVAKAFVASLQREQATLRAAWEKDTTTEDLRTALQQYRAFCGRLEGLA